MPRLRLRRKSGRAVPSPAKTARTAKTATTTKSGKAARRTRAERRAARANRFSQLRQAFTLTRQNDSRMLPIVIGVFVAVVVIFVLLGVLLHHPILLSIFGILFGFLAALSLFGRRAQRAALSQVEGQPGAAVAVVQSMRGQWDVTPVVAVTRNQDVVHRVIGRPGIVLVGEGNPGRLAQLLGQEKRRVGRVAAETPIYDVLVGEGTGQVPLRKLQSHMMKLPRNLKPAQVRAVEGRMRALGQAQVPLPKGPLPKNARMPRGRMR